MYQCSFFSVVFYLEWKQQIPAIFSDWYWGDGRADCIGFDSSATSGSKGQWTCIEPAGTSYRRWFHICCWCWWYQCGKWLFCHYQCNRSFQKMVSHSNYSGWGRWREGETILSSEGEQMRLKWTLTFLQILSWYPNVLSQLVILQFGFKQFFLFFKKNLELVVKNAYSVIQGLKNMINHSRVCTDFMSWWSEIGHHLSLHIFFDVCFF
jgi:hypothetical protein